MLLGDDIYTGHLLFENIDEGDLCGLRPDPSVTDDEAVRVLICTYLQDPCPKGFMYVDLFLHSD